MTLPAADRAAELIEQIGAGAVADCYIDVYPVKRAPARIMFSPERINALLGTKISRDEMLDIFRKIDMSYDINSNEIIAPTYRMDMSAEADLAEEVARFYGYNNIKATLGPGTVTTLGVLTPLQRLRKLTLDSVLSCGYSEIYTFSFQNPKIYDTLRLAADSPLRNAVRLANPLNEDMSVMRTTALPEMLQTICDNFNQRTVSAAFFEIASVYGPAKRSGEFFNDVVNTAKIDVAVADEFLPVQKTELTLGAYGGEHSYYTMKGVVETLLDALGIHEFRFIRCADIPYMHPGRSAYVMLGKKTAGYFGEVHPGVAEALSLPGSTLAGAVDLILVYKAAKTDRAYAPLPKYPPAPRDLSLLVAQDTPAGDIIGVIRKNGGPTLVTADVFDVYSGAQVPDGYKSIAFSLVFRSADRTLTDDEVHSRINKIVEALGKEFGAKLRT
jgi:phenylalanyl-tRNA synthetase beta chain